MNDLIQRLRHDADIFKYEEDPVEDLLREAAAELERLQARVAELENRLEIDPRHPYDGIDCRDETIRQQQMWIDAVIEKARTKAS